MNARTRREQLAQRLNDWITQEVRAGSVAQQRDAAGVPVTLTHILCDARHKSPELADAAALIVESALDLPCLAELRAGKGVGARAWMLVAERLGTTGPLPPLADVLATRRAYWAACDAAHERRLAAHRASAQIAHPKTPETPTNAPAGLYGAQTSQALSQTSQALPENTSANTTPAAASAPQALPARPYKPPRYLDGELVEAGDPWPEETYRRQLRWLADRAELDAPRAEVGEPWWVRRLADDVSRQDFEVWKHRREAARLTPPAWMDEAPAWGEEVRDEGGEGAGEGRAAAGRGADGRRCAGDADDRGLHG